MNANPIHHTLLAPSGMRLQLNLWTLSTLIRKNPRLKKISLAIEAHWDDQGKPWVLLWVALTVLESCSPRCMDMADEGILN